MPLDQLYEPLLVLFAIKIVLDPLTPYSLTPLQKIVLDPLPTGMIATWIFLEWCNLTLLLAR